MLVGNMLMTINKLKSLKVAQVQGCVGDAVCVMMCLMLCVMLIVILCLMLCDGVNDGKGSGKVK